MLLNSFAAAITIIILLFFIIEKRGLKLSVMLPVVVMTAAASVGRLIFAFLPNVQPVTIIVIIMGMCYSAEAGFLTGALSALVSSLIMGFGPWTIWQMLAWGLIGLIAGLIGKIKFLNNVGVCLIIGVISAFFFSAVMDIWTVSTLYDHLDQVGGIITVLAQGLLFNIPHAVFNAVFALLLYPPMKRKLMRIRTKY